MSIPEAITTLQEAIRAKYGGQVDTSTGEATLFIAHDRMELTDRDGTVQGETAEECAALLNV